MVGSIMACDMASDFEVTIVDVREESAQGAVKRAASKQWGSRVIVPRVADLSDGAAIRRLIEPYDIVLGALPSRIGFQGLKAVIESGKNYCDISFFEQDALELGALAKQRGSTVVVDCGVAPGMSNMIAGAEVAGMRRQGVVPQSVAIYVGGLPRERRLPFQYKAGFAPSDVIEEYTRPVRLVENGAVVIREALTESEWLEFPGLGTLEAVNTDGLRSLATTLGVPNMKEKTLRYPGHYDLMRAFRDTGLFSLNPVTVRSPENVVEVRPRDLTAALMFPKWTYAPNEEDLTVMRIIVSGGAHNGRFVSVTWDLFDMYHNATGATSMSRTTAMPCTAVARLIASGKLSKPGVHAPEQIAGEGGVLEHVLTELEKRGIHYARVTSEGSSPGH
jgi:saccharopine dehydrogenase-like NADP-dependent oxidoreductase